MHLKDYYAILEISPSATQAEIKKAYWRLAQLHHPDKNPGDPYAASLFTEIKEAYETLSHSSRKAIYLQQRWYEQSIGKKRKQDIITPVTVLKQSLELDKYVSSLDTHRMDREGLAAYIAGILSDHVLEKLEAFHEPATKKEIAFAILRSASPLNTQQFEMVSARVQRLSNDHAVTVAMLTQKKSLRRSQHAERYLPLILFFITIIICLVIYWLTR